jgi:hypothetical protein
MNRTTSSYCQLKGVSGTGKGTRVAQLMLFLCDRYNVKINKQKVDSDNEQCVAIEFEEPNIAIIGKVLKSPCGLLNLEGIDHKHEIKEYLYDKYKSWNLICEGFVLTGSDFFKPQSMLDKYDFKKQMWESYYYDNVEQLQERVTGRSGKRSSGKAFSGNKGIINEFENKIKPQCEENGFSCGLYKYDEAVTSFGIRYLHFVGLSELFPEFLTFSKRKSALRHITKPQDGDFFPTELHDYCGIDGSVTGGQKILTTEQFEVALNTPNPKEL